MPTPRIDLQYLMDVLVKLLNTPSPTGLTAQAIDLLESILKQYKDIALSKTRKGALVAKWNGDAQDRPRALTSHVDTLGAMVKEIKESGKLKLTRIGGYNWSTVEGEGCRIMASGGGMIRGTILLCKASGHVHTGMEIEDTKRNDENMEVRLDARTSSKEDTEALGIRVGDFVAFDPRIELVEGFIRSRHLDDKACVAVILAVIKSMTDAGFKPAQTTYLHFSNYEEVGHGGAAGIPADVHELVVVDMAAVGEGQASDEFHATLCIKDSGGPYHHGLCQKLRALAETNDIPYVTDIYPHYGSDGEAFWLAGGDVAVALIGPGVDASHNYERTHTEALLATANWLIAYLLEK
ncbi:MAG: M42 family metallopeptidase [Anaerolineaceae bacterium]